MRRTGRTTRMLESVLRNSEEKCTVICNSNVHAERMADMFWDMCLERGLYVTGRAIDYVSWFDVDHNLCSVKFVSAERIDSPVYGGDNEQGVYIDHYVLDRFAYLHAERATPTRVWNSISGLMVE